jgi:predicted DNA-binding transcriptional regulator YafY
VDRTERFYKIERLIRSRGSVGFEELRAELEVSRATLKRDLQYLRERMDAPIVYNRFDNVYRFSTDGLQPAHQLPGLWFSDTEIHALLTMHQLIQGLDGEGEGGGVLARHLRPLLDKLHGLLGGRGEAHELMKRVKIVSAARRPVQAQVFEQIGHALLQRRRLQLSYFTRGRGTQSERMVSPQRLVHYRSTWYLDAWCHRSDGLRRFALDAVRAVQPLEQRAKEVAIKTVQTELDAGYGVFAGRRVQWATLLFTAEAALWVAHEQWHPRQQLTVLAGGQLKMRLPYADSTELVMDLLRHGSQVQVMAPPALAAEVARRLLDAADLYAPADAKARSPTSESARPSPSNSRDRA